MTEKIYNVLDGIQRRGCDNSEWGLLQDEKTQEYFGETKEPEFEMRGKWIYLYGELPFAEEPDKVITLDYDIVNLWKID